MKAYQGVLVGVVTANPRFPHWKCGKGEPAALDNFYTTHVIEEKIRKQLSRIP